MLRRQVPCCVKFAVCIQLSVASTMCVALALVVNLTSGLSPIDLELEYNRIVPKGPARICAVGSFERIYTVDPTGQINLQTTYLDGTPAGATPELELSINTNLFEDPWNEQNNT
ncbi:hypothetical protein DFJ58DRAFT_841931 [Suillus subalutaceus]|uniref:uncharacterized protein n=1 Tax=Suillus subalutaceus TaxID=48586 RepID=UPI001B86A4D5|nr:uncharacterized protein DFJ58DRAFT_841931 [Suillus subalutaceus]KAG1852278.1 hypothetical protein DFJ58DRAFT_841931 [Suillus subalutaceus]